MFHSKLITRGAWETSSSGKGSFESLADAMAAAMVMPAVDGERPEIWIMSPGGEIVASFQGDGTWWTILQGAPPENYPN